jgi:hypothetical protein
MMSSMDELAG